MTIDKFIGKRLDGRYEIREAIGHGGMAVVYKAYDNIENRTVAVKILREEYLKNEEFRRRFKNESKVIAVLNHKNIVEVYDVSFGDIIQYIVMEYVEGITLKNYISQARGALPADQALNFTIQILKALSHAHEKGIIHRDIKPQNIILVDGQTVKVTDFGISRFSRSDQKTMTDKAIGSVHYISPEQAKCEQTDDKSDLYSVGVLMYEMLCGELPFEADSAVSVALMQLQNEPKPMHQLNPAIPLGLEQIVMHAMAKDPFRRYQTAEDMLRDIAEFQKNSEIIFDHSYFNDEQATKFIPDLTDEEPEEAVRKATITPIYIGIGIAILLALTAIIWGIVVLFSSAPGEAFDTPNFVYGTENAIELDLTIGEANQNRRLVEAELAALGVSFARIEFVENYHSTTVPRGQVASQTPNAGVSTRSGATLTLHLSLGPTTLTMPDLAGSSLQDAQLILGDLGIGFEYEEVHNNTVDIGTIITTDPAAGTAIARTAEVRIFVSSGPVPANVQVPDLIRANRATAERRLENLGLEVGQVTEGYSATVGAGFVISQSIAAETMVGAGTAINFVVSRGPEPPQSEEPPPPDEHSTLVRINFNDEMNHWVDDLRVTENGRQVHRNSAGFNLRTTASQSFTLTTENSPATIRIYLNNRLYQIIRISFTATGATQTITEDNWQDFVHVDAVSATPPAPSAPPPPPQSLPPQSLPPAVD